MQELTGTAKSFPRVKYPNVVLVNAGLSNVDASNVAFAGFGEVASLFVPTNGSRFAEWHATTKLVNVTQLRTLHQQYVDDWPTPRRLLYTAIDTEGHEPLVILGMHLDVEANRQRFSAFQFELGGTWAAGDPRHPVGSMTAPQTFGYLMARGYELYIIGAGQLLAMNPADVAKVSVADEGFGKYMTGNALAIHPEYAHEALLELVDTLRVDFTS